MNKTVFGLLKNILNEKSILCDEPMKNHTSFKIGGNADFVVLPESVEEVAMVVSALKENGIRYTVMGNGSNLLVDDAGLRGVVIKLARNFSGAIVEGNTISAESGILLSKLSNIALANSLKGLEFASGIPGTLGGAVIMNAGAYGGEMKDVVVKTVYLDSNGEIKSVEGADHGFGYRKSMFTSKDVVLHSTLVLSQGNKDEIKDKMSELNSQRKAKQPLEFPSAGSAFKRPEGYFAGKLIQDAGLKGYKIGGASVSEKHSGFIISDGSATCSDVLALIDHIQKEVFRQFSVELESEIRYIK
ncbi:MAG: UDP-N-acetylmuramate dehydrogenase [Ruminococcaceae bacterium]|nr:UDP-N-acetylmuramate dehydrogenase [Oscillospiraceae bacterium]